MRTRESGRNKERRDRERERREERDSARKRAKMREKGVQAFSAIPFSNIKIGRLKISTSFFALQKFRRHPAPIFPHWPRYDRDLPCSLEL